MIILGLTGSIGMGKSTTANMFREMGVPVHDADATVHELYEDELVGPLEAEFPGVTQNGAIDRAVLSKHVVGNEAAMKKLEALVHPAVHQREKAFLTKAEQDGVPLVVLDNPLLFEMGKSERVDKILIVTAPENVQRERVLARPDIRQKNSKQFWPDRSQTTKNESRATLSSIPPLGWKQQKKPFQKSSINYPLNKRSLPAYFSQSLREACLLYTSDAADE